VNRRRWLLAIGAAFALAGAGMAWLLATSGGARWVAGLARAEIDGLAIESVGGNLLDGLELGGVSWRGANTTITVRHARVDLALARMARGDLHIGALQAEGVRVRIDEPAEPQSPGERAPIDLVPLRIEAITLRDGRFETGDTAIDVGQASGALALGGSRIALQGLALRGPALALDGDLQFDIASRQPLRASTLRFDLPVAGPAHWRGKLAATPGPSDLQLALALELPLQATVSGTVADDLGRADLVLALPEQSAAALGLAQPVAADLRLLATDGRWTPRGTLSIDGQVATIEGGSVAPQGEVLSIEALALSLAGFGRVQVDGRVPLAADAAWALALDTGALAVPRAGAAPLVIAGGVVVDGSAETPRATANLRLASEGLPDATLAGSVLVAEGGLQAQGLRLQIGQGSATIDGLLSFAAPATLDLTVAAFDPSLLAPDWPGSVDARLRFNGALSDARVTGSLVLDSLGGTLRGRALTGKGSVEFAAGAWRDGALELTSGRATLRGEASGGGARVDVTANVPDLADLAPGWSGSLDARWIRTEGQRIEALARAVQFEGIRIGAVSIDASVGRGRNGALAATVQASDLDIAGQPITNLTLRGDGVLGSHAAIIEAELPQQQLAAALDGGWDGRAWKGRLERLEVRAARTMLSLQEPATLQVDAEGIDLQRACLTLVGGAICVGVSRQPGGGDATATLENLSLAGLRALWPDADLPALEGLVEGEGQARWRNGALLDASINVRSPRGLARLPQRPDLDLGYRELAFDARWADEVGSATGSAVLVPDGRLDLAATFDRDAAGEFGWDATLDVLVRQLDGIEAFTTLIAEPEGEVRGQLRSRGGYYGASLSGALALTGFTAQVPEYALRLREGVAVLAGVPGQLVLRGSVVSGDGTLYFDGRIDRDDPVPALLRITGDNVRVANTPTLSLQASPDLTLALREKRWQLDGRVAIPRARVNASRLEGGVARSPDVVVVDDIAPPDPIRPWRARVLVELGDDVRLEGFGFDGTLAGRINVSQRQGGVALANGEVTLQGRYEAYGQRLTIERGGLRWANSPLGDPILDLRAERKVRNQTVALEVRGNALSPEARVVAGPGISDSEALALLVTGRPLNRAGAEDREQLGDAAAALGAVGSELLTRNLRGRLGLDEIGVSNDTRLDGEAFTLGKYLSPRLYVGYGIGLLTRGEVFTVRYLLTDRIELEASSGESQRAAVNYRIER
jgi:translocation and assembly module TamB